MKLETRGVLAGAYRARDPKSLLTHAVEVDGDGNELRVLCRRVKLESIGDRYGAKDVNARPTCEPCAKAWDKAQGKAGPIGRAEIRRRELWERIGPAFDALGGGDLYPEEIAAHLGEDEDEVRGVLEWARRLGFVEREKGRGYSLPARASNPSRSVYSIRWPGRRGKRRRNPSDVVTLRPVWHDLKKGGKWNAHVRRVGHKRSGVYALRDRTSREVVYVGESHTGRLWKTLLHHFQGIKAFEKLGEWVHGAPERLEVAVWLFPASEAVDAEGEVIERLEPSGNLRRMHVEEESETPF